MRKLNKSSTGVKRWLDGDATGVKRDLPPSPTPTLYTVFDYPTELFTYKNEFNPELIQICQAVSKIQIEPYLLIDDKCVNEMMD